MNGKTAKKLRRFAEIRDIPYDSLKKVFKKTNRTIKPKILKQMSALHKPE